MTRTDAFATDLIRELGTSWSCGWKPLGGPMHEAVDVACDPALNKGRRVL